MSENVMNLASIDSKRQFPGLGRLPLRRIAAFAGVGAACLAVQLLLLQFVLWRLDPRTHVDLIVANAAAFLVATQLNYWLSRTITWRDRCPADARARSQAKQHISFNLMALCGLGMNQVVFLIAERHIGAVPASGLGTVVSSGLTLALSAFAIFPAEARGKREQLDAIG